MKRQVGQSAINMKKNIEENATKQRQGNLGAGSTDYNNRAQPGIMIMDQSIFCSDRDIVGIFFSFRLLIVLHYRNTFLKCHAIWTHS